MASGRIASRYSKSLLDLAKEQNGLEEIKSDMDTILELTSNSKDLNLLLKNPVVSADKKKAILAKVFPDISKTTTTFIAFLVDKNRTSELPMVASKFIESYNKIKGISKVNVISAVELSNETLDSVKKYAKGMVGDNELEITNTIDPSIIGGLVIKHGDKLLDMSVSKELREIRKSLIYN
jgi:F-type H+-transporting ATPase subunit delta